MNNLEINKELFKMSDMFCTEPIEFDNVSGEKLLGKMVLNRVVNISYKNLIKKDCKKLGEFESSLKLLYNENLNRAKVCKDNIGYVCTMLDKAEFPYALLKGSYLITQVYELGDRLSNDIDILINETNVGACKKLLLEEGFLQGYLENGVFKEASRADIIMSKMNFGETIPFSKEIDGRYITIDMNFSVDYKPMEDDAIITKMLDRRIKLPLTNTTLVTLGQVDFLIYLCLHLYKEATTFDWVERRHDLKLYKFIDLYLLFHENSSQELYDNLVDSIREYGVDKECYYAFLRTKDIYKELCNVKGYEAFLERIKPEKTEYLYEIINPMEKKIYKYEMDFIEWFSCEDRVAHLVEARQMDM